MSSKIKGYKKGVAAAAAYLEGVSAVSEFVDRNIFDEVALRAPNGCGIICFYK